MTPGTTVRGTKSFISSSGQDTCQNSTSLCSLYSIDSNRLLRQFASCWESDFKWVFPFILLKAICFKVLNLRSMIVFASIRVNLASHCVTWWRLESSSFVEVDVGVADDEDVLRERVGGQREHLGAVLVEEVAELQPEVAHSLEINRRGSIGHFDHKNKLGRLQKIPNRMSVKIDHILFHERNFWKSSKKNRAWWLKFLKVKSLGLNSADKLRAKRTSLLLHGKSRESAELPIQKHWLS